MQDWPCSSGCRDAPRQGPASLHPSLNPPAPQLPSTYPGSSTSMQDRPCSSGCRDAPRQGPALLYPSLTPPAPQLPSTYPASDTSMQDCPCSSGCRDAPRQGPVSSSPPPKPAVSPPLSTDHRPHIQTATCRRHPELRLCRLGVLHRREAKVSA